MFKDKKPSTIKKKKNTEKSDQTGDLVFAAFCFQSSNPLSNRIQLYVPAPELSSATLKNDLDSTTRFSQQYTDALCTTLGLLPCICLIYWHVQ